MSNKAMAHIASIFSMVFLGLFTGMSLTTDEIFTSAFLAVGAIVFALQAIYRAIMYTGE